MTITLRGAGLLAPSQRRLASSSRSHRSKRPPPPPLPPRPPRPSPQQAPTIRPYKPIINRKPPAPPTPPPPTQPDTLLSLWRRSWIPLTGASLVAGCLGFYIVGTVVATSFAAPDGDATPTGRPPALTGENAARFDRELDYSEWWMGISGLRRALAGYATGHVLEVAVGGGRNLKYYDWRPLCVALEQPSSAVVRRRPLNKGITSFTGLDINVDMLDVARRGLIDAVPPLAAIAPLVTASSMADHMGGRLSFLGDRVRLVHADVHGRLPTPPTADARYYDTVIQTFGLCSVSNPVAVLTNLASVVKPGSGRIILLEHGRGWFGLINGLLDRYAGGHCAKFGCWWNRDIDAIIRQAAEETPGLEIIKLERPRMWQFGTLLRVELRVVEEE
ncbi:hypothetical protein XA68_17521 [Ophiocordyceps unilateralis]|uniref:Methyltransferase type 11 domain-containing protein n=1 Tax=Ophiocordyceps unilateralis TaxID=268505 RepID=A0A2A9P3U2_OPHUN|nr:hypothetical protein XA68_17521 [Ophiocordyceps unilateralis]